MDTNPVSFAAAFTAHLKLDLLIRTHGHYSSEVGSKPKGISKVGFTGFSSGMSLLRSLQQSGPVQRSILLFRRRPYLVLGSGIFLLFLLFLYELYPPALRARPNDIPNHGPNPFLLTGFNGTWDWRRDGKNFLLDEEQCEQAFPGLFDEVKRAVRDRNGKQITFEEVDRIEPVNGYIRGMIYEHEVSCRPVLLPCQFSLLVFLTAILR